MKNSIYISYNCFFFTDEIARKEVYNDNTNDTKVL